MIAFIQAPEVSPLMVPAFGSVRGSAFGLAHSGATAESPVAAMFQAQVRPGIHELKVSPSIYSTESRRVSVSKTRFQGKIVNVVPTSCEVRLSWHLGFRKNVKVGQR